MIGFASKEEEDEADGLSEVALHPAEVAGCLAWYVCKHCPAWLEYDLDGDDEGL